VSAKAVGSFLPTLTARAFRRHGFSTSGLVTDWPAIAGRELGNVSMPERLKWPRAAGPADGENAGACPARSGATLVLRVDGSSALTVQYGARQIIERINAYFGYRAVSQLRIVQAPVAPPPASVAPLRRPAEPLTHEVAGIRDQGLRLALARLGAQIKAAR
jgi:hypothetical protein